MLSFGEIQMFTKRGGPECEQAVELDLGAGGGRVDNRKPRGQDMLWTSGFLGALIESGRLRPERPFTGVSGPFRSKIAKKSQKESFWGLLCRPQKGLDSF